MLKKVFSTIVSLCLIVMFGCAAYEGERPSELPAALPACVYYDGIIYSHQGKVIYSLPENAEIIGETNNVGLDMKSDLDSTVDGYVYINLNDFSSLIFRWKNWDESIDGKEPFLILDGSAINDDIGPGLFSQASPETSAIHMYFYDGSEGISGYLFNPVDERRSIVELLNQVDAVMVDDWTPEMITYPVYGLEIGSEDGNGYRTFWSNGYLVMRDGKVYRFDFDFGKVWKEHSWCNKCQLVALADMPCARYLVQNENGWIATNMHPADDPEGLDNIFIKCIEWTDERIVFELENNGSDDWPYGSYYSLDVQLDGKWYSVPMNCDYNYVFTDELIYLKAGESKQITISLIGATHYSNLPAGHYRLVVYGATFEQDIL